MDTKRITSLWLLDLRPRKRRRVLFGDSFRRLEYSFFTKFITFLLLTGLNLTGISAVGSTAARFSDIEGSNDNLFEATKLDFILEGTPYVPVTNLPPSLSSGLVAHYLFDDGTATDVSGSGNHGALQGATTTLGKFGSGLSFDGIDDYVGIPDSSSLDVAEVTFATWIYKKSDPSSNWQCIVCRQYFGSTTMPWLDVLHLSYDYTESDHYAFGTRTLSGQDFTEGPSSDGDVGSWIHLVGSYDGTTLKLYRNGVLVSSKAHTFGGNMIPEATFTTLGGGYNGPGQDAGMIEHADIILDDLRVYDRALSDSEIDALYNVSGTSFSAERNVKVVDDVLLTPGSSTPFRYIVKPTNPSGELPFCEALSLEASLEGILVYNGTLLNFISATTTFGPAGDDWTFKLTTPYTPGFGGDVCNFDFEYSGWQENMSGLFTGFHDVENIGNTIVGNESKLANECPFDEGSEQMIVHFNTHVLRSDTTEADATDGPVVGFLPAGTYDITLASYDNHFIKPTQVQPEEQWELRMKNAAGVEVAVTAPIRDIVDATEEQVIEKVAEDFIISDDVNLFTARHSAYPDSNPNSLRALCALFEGEGLGETLSLIPPPSGRVLPGMLALYTFEETSGKVVFDVSGVGAPLHLWIPDLTKVSRAPGLLSIDASTIVSSLVPGTKLIDGLKATNEITVEAWVNPANTTQAGPARIATLSRDIGFRNFTLGVEETKYAGRIRTPTTGLNGSFPTSFFTPTDVASTTLQHVVLTRGADATERFYIDGVEVAARANAGVFSSWDPSYRFGLANEFDMLRTWLGDLHLVAIYDKALSASDVAQNYAAGADFKDVVLNEYLPNPAGDDGDPKPLGEWVELYNLTSSPVDVAGWTLYDSLDSHPLTISVANSDNDGDTGDGGETIVPANGFLVVYLDGAYGSGWLNNSGGDEVRLYRGGVGSASLADATSYVGSAPVGKSYARIPDGTGAWVDPIPTPGLPNRPEEPVEATTSLQSSPEEETADLTPPTLTLNGNNPAYVEKGATYADLGAMVSDNSTGNLGYHIEGEVRTDELGEYTLMYTATDQAGNMNTAERLVIVYDPEVGPPLPSRLSDEATSTDEAPWPSLLSLPSLVEGEDDEVALSPSPTRAPSLPLLGSEEAHTSSSSIDESTEDRAKVEPVNDTGDTREATSTKESVVVPIVEEAEVASGAPAQFEEHTEAAVPEEAQTLEENAEPSPMKEEETLSDVSLPPAEDANESKSEGESDAPLPEIPVLEESPDTEEKKIEELPALTLPSEEANESGV